VDVAGRSQEPGDAPVVHGHSGVLPEPVDQGPQDVGYVLCVVDQMHVVDHEDPRPVAEHTEFAHERINDRLATGACRTEVVDHGHRRLRKVGHELPPCSDQVPEHAWPALVALIEAIPEGAMPAPPGEVGQQGRLAVPSLSGHENDPVVDLHPDPIEEALPRQRRVAQGRFLDLGRLNWECVRRVA